MSMSSEDRSLKRDMCRKLRSIRAFLNNAVLQVLEQEKQMLQYGPIQEMIQLLLTKLGYNLLESMIADMCNDNTIPYVDISKRVYIRIDVIYGILSDEKQFDDVFLRALADADSATTKDVIQKDFHKFLRFLLLSFVMYVVHALDSAVSAESLKRLQEVITNSEIALDLENIQILEKNYAAFSKGKKEKEPLTKEYLEKEAEDPLMGALETFHAVTEIEEFDFNTIFIVDTVLDGILSELENGATGAVDPAGGEIEAATDATGAVDPAGGEIEAATNATDAVEQPGREIEDGNAHRDSKQEKRSNRKIILALGISISAAIGILCRTGFSLSELFLLLKEITLLIEHVMNGSLGRAYTILIYILNKYFNNNIDSLMSALQIMGYSAGTLKSIRSIYSKKPKGTARKNATLFSSPNSPERLKYIIDLQFRTAAVFQDSPNILKNCADDALSALEKLKVVSEADYNELLVKFYETFPEMRPESTVQTSASFITKPNILMAIGVLGIGLTAAVYYHRQGMKRKQDRANEPAVPIGGPAEHNEGREFDPLQLNVGRDPVENNAIEERFELINQSNKKYAYVDFPKSPDEDVTTYINRLKEKLRTLRGQKNVVRQYLRNVTRLFLKIAVPKNFFIKKEGTDASQEQYYKARQLDQMFDAAEPQNDVEYKYIYVSPVLSNNHMMNPTAFKFVGNMNESDVLVNDMYDHLKECLLTPLNRYDTRPVRRRTAQAMKFASAASRYVVNGDKVTLRESMENLRIGGASSRPTSTRLPTSLFIPL